MSLRFPVSAFAIAFAMSIAMLIGNPAMPVLGAKAAAVACTPQQVGVVIIVDDSGSMLSNDPKKMRGEGAAAAIDMLRDGAVVATSVFTGTARQVSVPTALSAATRPALKTAARGALRSSGGTGYQYAFLEAKRQLDSMPSTVTKRGVIFLSDGEPSDPNFTADLDLVAAGVTIHTVGFGGAPGAVLNSIATRAGGSYSHVVDVADLVPAFANITAALSCDVSIGTGGTVLKPGDTWKYPFTPTVNTSEVRGLISWPAGVVAVTVKRPDGSVMSQTTLRANETYTADKLFTSFGMLRPAVGTWVIEMKSSALNQSDVDVNLQLWNRPPLVKAIGCPAFLAARDGSYAIKAGWAGVAADPRATYVLTLAPGTKPPLNTTATDAVLTGGIGPGIVYTLKLTAYVVGKQVGVDCIRSVSMGAVAPTKGTEAADIINGSSWIDIIYGYGGNDTINALAHNDKLYGGAGNDTMDGGDGSDTMKGEAGDDNMLGGAGRDNITSGLGSDTLDGGAGDDTMFGDEGNDTMVGGDGIDTITGGDGADTINARDGRIDTIGCGAGVDTVTADKIDRINGDCDRVTRL